MYRKFIMHHFEYSTDDVQVRRDIVSGRFCEIKIQRARFLAVKATVALGEYEFI